MVIEDGAVTVYISPIAQDGSLSRREAERAAVAKILAEVSPGATLGHTEQGAPKLEGDDVMPYVSISHCRTHAAVAVCHTHPVGIDIEEPRQQLQRIADRFLSDADRRVMADFTPELSLLQAWTAKEAAYKLAPAAEQQTLSTPAVALGRTTSGLLTANRSRIRFHNIGEGLLLAIAEG